MSPSKEAEVHRFPGFNKGIHHKLCSNSVDYSFKLVYVAEKIQCKNALTPPGPQHHLASISSQNDAVLLSSTSLGRTRFNRVMTLNGKHGIVFRCVLCR